MTANTDEQIGGKEEIQKSISVWGYHVAKRVFDFCSSLVALVVLSPVFFVTAALVKLEDGGPAFYQHTRVGQNGKEIKVYKFRSMRVNADQLENMLTPDQVAQYHREFKIERDPMVTKIGRLLRQSSLDELPQLVNILCGQMSIVGPRPLMKDELSEKYSSSQQELLLSVRPGLTGLWQVSGRSECTYESGERQKLELSYVEMASPWVDARILLKTVKVVLVHSKN